MVAKNSKKAPSKRAALSQVPNQVPAQPNRRSAGLTAQAHRSYATKRANSTRSFYQEAEHGRQANYGQPANYKASQAHLRSNQEWNHPQLLRSSNKNNYGSSSLSKGKQNQFNEQANSYLNKPLQSERNRFSHEHEASSYPANYSRHHSTKHFSSINQDQGSRKNSRSARQMPRQDFKAVNDNKFRERDLKGRFISSSQKNYSTISQVGQKTSRQERGKTSSRLSSPSPSFESNHFYSRSDFDPRQREQRENFYARERNNYQEPSYEGYEEEVLFNLEQNHEKSLYNSQREPRRFNNVRR